MKQKSLSSVPCGFAEGGRRYVVRDPRLIPSADTDLWNDRMYLQIDHRGRVRSASFNQPNGTSYSENGRFFYIRDEADGRCFSAPYDPMQVRPGEFEFSAGWYDCVWRNVTRGIEVTLRLMVPRNDCVELWTATVKNVSGRTREVSLFSYLPIGDVGLLAHETFWDPQLCGTFHKAFPYYVKWQDYYALRKLRNHVFCAADRRPSSHCSAAESFEGFGGTANPDALRSPRLTERIAKHERGAAVFQYQWKLGRNQSQTVNLVFGPAFDRREAMALKRKYLSWAGMEHTRSEWERFMAANAPVAAIETPDADLDAFANYWLPRRILMSARTFRFNNCPQARNVIQDSMGAVFVAPDTARRLFPQVWRHQHRSGFTPHGLPMAEGVAMMPIGLIPHRDTNVWGPLTVAMYVRETGDEDALRMKIPFADRGQATLYGHINAGLDWLLRDRTRRGLSRLGQGDWNDPLNMAGKDDRGESVWLTEALAFALDTWAPIAERMGEPERARRYRHEAEKCRRVINRLAWDGAWYARGTTDAGRWFGVRSAREGKIFLNAQSWSVICGAARGRRMESVIRSVEKHLMTPSGPMKLAPAYQDMREEIGKLTQKPAGMNENGSVYCHAATFYAYALYAVGKTDAAFEALMKLLVGHGRNTIRRAQQIPINIPNLYRGLPAGPTAGLSSRHYNTGTAAWYYLALLSMLLGVQPEFDGLRFVPQLPSGWRGATLWRRWRGARFHIRIERLRDTRRVTVQMDGMPLRGDTIPPQRPGSTHDVTVWIPMKNVRA